MKTDVEERDQPCFFWRHFSVIVPALLLCSCARSELLSVACMQLTLMVSRATFHPLIWSG